MAERRPVLAPEAFFLPAVEFTDAELAALQTALSLLDGEFAYAEPLRLALQQLTWGRPSPLGSPAQRAIGLGITGSAGGAELSARLAKVDTAIYRRKRIEFEYFTIQSGETATRKVDPYELLFEGGQFYPTEYASARLVLAWAMGYEHHARVLGPPELVEELQQRLERVAELHRGEPFTTVAAGRPPRDAEE